MRVEIDQRNWSDLSRHPRLLQGREGIEGKLPETATMTHLTSSEHITTSQYLVGRLVYLDRYDCAGNEAEYLRWRQRKSYLHLFASDPLVDPCSDRVDRLAVAKYAIRSLRNGQLIGEIALENIDWDGGKASLGVAIGESGFWNQGYATDAVRTLRKYAFEVLRLRSISMVLR